MSGTSGAGSAAATVSNEPATNSDALHSIISTLGDGNAQRELTGRLEQCLAVLRGAEPSNEKSCGDAATDPDNLIDLGVRYMGQRKAANNRLADAVDELCRIIGA